MLVDNDIPIEAMWNVADTYDSEEGLDLGLEVLHQLQNELALDKSIRTESTELEPIAIHKQQSEQNVTNWLMV